MKNGSRVSRATLRVTSLVVIGQCLAASPASAQDQAEAEAPVGEIVVTANRRTQDVTEVPYNVTAIGGDQISQSGVSSVEDLSRQVPNLVVTSSGTQTLGAQRQVMRGLSASPGDRTGQTLEQNSVSTYLENSPYANYFPIGDVERVEVLRGPQGTLYGAGALGGAIRYIPNAPKLGKFSGSLSVNAGLLAHSSEADYGVTGMVNIPIGETLALRLLASHERNAGYIDVVGLFQTEGDKPQGKPVLINPANPVTSSAARENLKDVNRDESTALRASLLWQPIDEFKAQLAYNRVESDGFGPNADSPLFNGGADPFDPAIVYPDTDKYEVVRRYREPFERTSDMWSLDLSYDVGFATVSSTSTLFKTDGELFSESTLGTAALPAVFVSYYTGTPTNPRFNAVGRFTDRNRSFTQEVRLVSNGIGSIDYVIGAFYQRERRTDLWSSFGFGQFDYNQLPGVVSNSGIGPDDRYFTVGGKQVFTDRSVFGEVTWHATSRLDIAGGFRLFKQKLERDVESNIPNFFLFEQAQNTAEFSDAVFKLNVSYEFDDRNRLYAVFSQGFRRGGANAFAISGFAQEPTSILSYKPDLVDNYEIGLKGRVLNGWLYTVDLFYNRWSNPQIGTFTPYNLWPVTVNGKRARSAGFEFEARGPLGPDWYLSLGYAYTDAKLTADFCVPAGVGDGVNFDPCAIPGASGTTLPSAPKHSGTATLDYSHEFGGGNKLTVSANVNYKGSMRQNLPAINSRYVMLPSYVLTNLNIAFETGPWTISGYARNLFDVRPVYSAYSRITPFVPLDRVDTIGQPRELGIGLKYSW